MSRLQQAAEAYKELERRRKDRSNKKSKNGRPTGGMVNYASLLCRISLISEKVDVLSKRTLATVGIDNRYLRYNI